MEDDYYVYVYIDPRNYQEFYYGKGRGARKDAHLDAGGDSEKTRLIKEITAAGLRPIIKVVAANLTESDAYLIEKTLIWKLGRTLTNVATGHYAEKFRPPNTLHKNLAGFDFRNGIYYVNIGAGVHRSWDDCRRYGFLSAGQGRKYSDQIRGLYVGDVVAAYYKTKGYVGIGIVQQAAVRARDVQLNGKTLLDLPLKIKRIMENAESADKSEYLVQVQWKCTVDAEQAKWKSEIGLFSSQLIRASLAGQPTTVQYLEGEFGIQLESLLT